MGFSEGYDKEYLDSFLNMLKGIDGLLDNVAVDFESIGGFKNAFTFMLTDDINRLGINDCVAEFMPTLTVEVDGVLEQIEVGIVLRVSEVDKYLDEKKKLVGYGSIFGTIDIVDDGKLGLKVFRKRGEFFQKIGVKSSWVIDIQGEQIFYFSYGNDGNMISKFPLSVGIKLSLPDGREEFVNVQESLDRVRLSEYIGKEIKKVRGNE